MKKIAILMTCHNRKQKTLLCVKSVFYQIGKRDLKVILVDDGSIDGTSELIKSLFPSVNIIAENGSLFWCGGMRLAWQCAAKDNPDFYLWVNDDTQLYNNALDVLLDTWSVAQTQGKPETIIVGTCCDPITKNQTYGGEKRLGRHPARVIPVPASDQPEKCDTFNGNIVLVPRCVYNKIGIMRSFTHAIADTDYGYLASRAGCQLLVAPGILGECAHNANVNNWRDTSLPRLTRFRKLIGPKGLPPADWWKFLCAHAGWRAVFYWFGPYFTVFFR